jgi:hypothetical protein
MRGAVSEAEVAHAVGGITSEELRVLAELERATGEWAGECLEALERAALQIERLEQLLAEARAR